jgi:hypothetical protein
LIATKKKPGHFTLPGLLQVVASACGPLVSGWLAVSGDGGQPSAWAHGVQSMGGFHNLKVEIVAVPPACTQGVGETFYLGVGGAANFDARRAFALA